MKYKTRQFIVSAVQWTGDNYHQLIRFVGQENIRDTHDDLEIYDSWHHVWVPLCRGDYVIKGLKSEFCAKDRDEFNAEFERIGYDDFEKNHIVLTGGIHDGKMLTTDVDSGHSISFNGDRYYYTEDILNGRRVYEFRANAYSK